MNFPNFLTIITIIKGTIQKSFDSDFGCKNVSATKIIDKLKEWNHTTWNNLNNLHYFK